MSKNSNKRSDGAERFQMKYRSNESAKERLYFKMNFGWIAKNYELKYGLRGDRWTWQTIKNGIV